MKKKICEQCEQVEKRKLYKINGLNLCSKCHREIRKNHRKETLENSDEKEKIKKLNREIKNKYARERYRKRHPKKEKVSSPPIIKGSKNDKKKEKSNSYLTFQEKQILFKTLIKNGIDEEEVKQRIKELVESQKFIRRKMIEQNKSEEEIKSKQRELIERLMYS